MEYTYIWHFTAKLMYCSEIYMYKKASVNNVVRRPSAIQDRCFVDPKLEFPKEEAAGCEETLHLLGVTTAMIDSIQKKRLSKTLAVSVPALRISGEQIKTHCLDINNNTD